MKWLRKLRRKLRVMLHRDSFSCDLEEEMQSHLEMQAEENRTNGMDAVAARYAARRQFGNATLFKETSRDAWGWACLEGLWRDLRHAARLLVHDPAFTMVAIVSLALGIGANVAIFSVFNALMLRSLPVSHPEQLVLIHNVSGWGRGFASYPLYLALRERKDLFDGVLARGGVQRVRFGRDSAEFVDRELVSGNYFQVLGIQPVMGRLFTDEDNQTPGAHPYVVLSYSFWRTRYGADPSVLGRVVEVDERPLTVIGVAQPRFNGVGADRRADLWVPAAAAMSRANMADPRRNWAYMLARRRSGVGEKQLQAALNVLMSRHLAAVYGAPTPARRMALDQRLEVRPGSIGLSIIRDQFEKPLEILLGVVGLVLLVACANVGGLMLARGAARRREVALRFSLGASRLRVLRQLVIESVLLATAGAAIGVALAVWGGRYLLLLIPSAQMLQLDVSPDHTVLAFVAAVALASVAIFGLLPAFRATAVDPAPALKEVGGAGGSLRIGWRRVFVVAQVALSAIIVITAGLFVRSLGSLRSVDLGFHNLNVLSMFLDFPRNYNKVNTDSLQRHFLARVSALPGVLSTSCGFPGPYQHGRWDASFRIPGSEKTAREAQSVELQSAAPRYFETIGSPPVRGREFDTRDSASAPKVAIVNEAFAREYFGAADPVGRVLSFNDEKPEGGEPTNIVGVVRDMRHLGVRDRPLPMVYVPASQQSIDFPQFLLVRTAVPPGMFIPVLRRTLAALDPSVALLDVGTLRQQIDDSIYLDRLLAVVSGFFGVLSLLLAGVGIYGVMAYVVEQRTGEIGIRMALGAKRGNVLWLVLREGSFLIAAGLLVGLPISFLAVRVASSLLFGIKARDPFTLLATPAVLLAAAMLACYIPARRASRIDPMEALRHE